MSMRALTAFVALGLSLVACGDKVTVNDAVKGKAGESCTKRDDCEGQLSCIEGRCATAQTPDAEDGSVPQGSGGRPGESCTRRADCQTGLVCMDQVCVEDSDTLHNDAGISAQRGDRGETCTQRSDCQEGLSCVASRCRDNDYQISVQAKQCMTVDCNVDADCCRNQTFSTQCPTYKATCESSTATVSEKQIACFNYNNYCQCSRACESSVCTTVTRCTTNTECAGTGVCSNNKCVACNTKSDCASSSAECIDHVCKTPCTRNEECPIFFNCNTGKCSFAGCTSDRECFFYTKDPRAKCLDKECVTSCVSDGECAGAFEVCEKGSCINVGCENDNECRSYFSGSVLGQKSAVCREPAAKQ